MTDFSWRTMRIIASFLPNPLESFIIKYPDYRMGRQLPGFGCLFLQTKYYFF